MIGEFLTLQGQITTASFVRLCARSLRKRRTKFGGAVRALSRNEIEAALLEDDMTIYPLVVPGHPSREERLANTDPVYPPREAPLTPRSLTNCGQRRLHRIPSHTTLRLR
jgi:hypothetical protein